MGLYVDADRAIRARRLDLVSSTPGFKAAIYGSASGVPPSIDGWTRLTPPATVGEEKSFTLGRDGRRYRYYLVWITELPESGKARIQELGLKR